MLEFLIFSVVTLFIGVMGLYNHYSKSEQERKQEKENSVFGSYDPALYGAWGAFIIGIITLLVFIFQAF